MSAQKVCFISLRSYPLLAKNSLDYFGGAEVQMTLIARELAKDRHFAVSLITGNYGQRRKIKTDRLTVYKTKFLDFFNLLHEIDADVYVERTINPKIFLVSWWCRLFKKKLIYMLAHDWDCVSPYLRLAQAIITQSRQQQSLIKHKLRLDSSVMYPIIGPEKPQQQSARKYYLWVGRADDWKRPLEFIELAGRYPKKKFVMICREGKNKHLFHLVKSQAAKSINLRFYDAVAAGEILNFFRQAKLLVNTSLAEGWPNTFLQAGLTKTPVLSFGVNPDNYLNRFRCGWTGRSLPRLNPRTGLNHYRYVKKHHSLKNLNILKRLLYNL